LLFSLLMWNVHVINVYGWSFKNLKAEAKNGKKNYFGPIFNWFKKTLLIFVILMPHTSTFLFNLSLWNVHVINVYGWSFRNLKAEAKNGKKELFLSSFQLVSRKQDWFLSFWHRRQVLLIFTSCNLRFTEIS
jgi:hypothetical protein